MPDTLKEGGAAEIVSRGFLCIELSLHDNLCGNARMVGARQPEGVVAPHAMPSSEAVHEGLIEGMPHVKRARDIRRGQLDAEGLFALGHARLE